jgi:hypothetical protein
MAHLFDKGMLTTRPGNLPLPFYQENPPPLVRTLVLL